MSGQSKNIAALVPSLQADLVLEERPIPTPGEGEILVRNLFVPVNPIDWKRQAWNYLIPSYPVILGSGTYRQPMLVYEIDRTDSVLLPDLSGIVESVGSSVTKFKPGDRVVGTADSFSTHNNDHSSFQTYSIVSEVAAGKLPDNISSKDGATLLMGIATALVAFGTDFGLPVPTGKPQNQESALLVWGGASSVGVMGVQLAKAFGLTVYATASPTHHAKLKSFGAAAVFDYHSPTVVDEIVNTAQSAGKPINFVLDAISEESTLAPCAEVLKRLGKKGSPLKLAHTIPWAEGLEKSDDIIATHIKGESIWAERKDLSIWLYHEFLMKALQDGTIVPSPEAQVVDGGLGGLQTAMNLLKAGVSGKKLMVKVD